MTMVPPTLHSIITTMPFFTHAGSLSQLGVGRLRNARNWFSRPAWPLRTSRKRVPTATAGVTFGR
jgi:hypothetical protein